MGVVGFWDLVSVRVLVLGAKCDKRAVAFGFLGSTKIGGNKNWYFIRHT